MNSPGNGSTAGVRAPQSVDATCTEAGAADVNKHHVTCAAALTDDNVKNTTSATTESVGDDGSVGDDDLRFGYCCFRPTWLQWLNNAAGAVTFICIANAVQGFANGLFGVILSTIEKRFDLSSSDSSIIAIGYEIGPIPIILFFTFYGDRIHRPISMAIGLLTVAVGCVLFFIPQFTTPPYRPQGSGRSDDMCISGNRSTCVADEDGESLSEYLPIFIIARLLMGMGSTPIITIAVNYIDDFSTKEKFARYCGLFMAMSVVGPAVGFYFGASILSLFTDFYSFSNEEIGIKSSDPSWVGCWWLPYTVAAGLCLIDAVPMWGYPRDLPGAAEIRATKVDEAHGGGSSVTRSQSPRVRRTFAEFGLLAKSVLTNPTYLALTFYLVCDKFIIGSLIAYGTKLFQYVLNMSPTLAGVTYATFMLPAGIIGNIVAGLMIEKFRLTCHQIIKVLIVFAAITTAGTLILLMIDEIGDFAGVTAPYNSSLTVESTSLGLIDVCNANCSCDGLSYNPICSHSNIQYFSPCHAGCVTKDAVSDTEYAYYNCSCISTPEDASQPSASSGQCSWGSQAVTIAFLALYFVINATLNVGTVANAAATLRCVAPSETTFAFSMQVLISKLLGYVTGPLAMGAVFDGACILWQPLVTTCSDGTEDVNSGSCVLYDTRKLAIDVMILMFSFKGLTTVTAIVAAVVYRPQGVANAMEVDVKSADVKCDMGGDCPHLNKASIEAGESTDNVEPDTMTGEAQLQTEGQIEMAAIDDEANCGLELYEEIETEQCRF